MAAAPELAPIAERVVLRQLLIPLTALCAYLFVWGLCQAVVAVARAFFGTAEGALGWIPFVGKVVEHKLTDIEHKIVSLIGGYGHHFENQFFTRWHALGSLLRLWAHRIEEGALTSFHIARAVAVLWGQLAVGNTKGLRAYLHRLERFYFAQVAPRLDHALGLARAAAPAALTRRVGALAGDLEHVITWDLPHLRARTKRLEDEYARLRDRIGASAKAIATTAFIGAVAIALGKLGAGWTTCRPWRKIGKQVCTTPLGDIEALLALFATGAIVADFRELVKLAQTVEHGVASVLQDVAKA